MTQTLSTLHFLIHPMFIGDTTRMPHSDPFVRIGLEYASTELGLRYALRASRLEPTEAMVVFTHLTPEELKDRKDGYTDYYGAVLETLDSLLGRRAILVPGNYDLFGGYRVVGEVNTQMRRRGLRINGETMAYAYGEQLRAYVAQAASNLQEGFDLKGPTTVEIGLTDAFAWWPQADEPEKKAIRAQFRSLGLVLNEESAAAVEAQPDFFLPKAADNRPQPSVKVRPSRFP